MVDSTALAFAAARIWGRSIDAVEALRPRAVRADAKPLPIGLSRSAILSLL